MLDLAAITLNKNSVPGDKSAVVPGGVRIGSPALTTRGFVQSDFHRVADFLDRCASLNVTVALDPGNNVIIHFDGDRPPLSHTSPNEVGRRGQQWPTLLW